MKIGCEELIGEQAYACVDGYAYGYLTYRVLTRTEITKHVDAVHIGMDCKVGIHSPIVDVQSKQLCSRLYM